MRRGDRPRIEVADEGPGIAPEERERIWKKLYRGEQAISSPNRGSGLGLTVVKQLVELHGGQVGARNTLHRGTTFSFTLPIGE